MEARLWRVRGQAGESAVGSNWINAEDTGGRRQFKGSTGERSGDSRVTGGRFLTIPQ